jgi:hypothetical protein
MFLVQKKGESAKKRLTPGQPRLRRSSTKRRVDQASRISQRIKSR